MIILDFIFGSLYAVVFYLALLVFHPIQVVAYNLFGWRAHQKTIVALNFVLGHGLKVAGTTLNCKWLSEIPENKPVIFVSNHQSKFDIVSMCWYLRKHYPLYVSKVELSKGIPSISYNLRKSGAALINRKDRKQAIGEILRLGRKAENENRGVIIFPEGTRSKSGKLGKFASGGLTAFLKTMPSAAVVPVAISGTGKIEGKGLILFRAFKKVEVTITEPISREGITIEELTEKCRKRIAGILNQE